MSRELEVAMLVERRAAEVVGPIIIAIRSMLGDRPSLVAIMLLAVEEKVRAARLEAERRSKTEQTGGAAG